MLMERNELERLISRSLDGEITARERARLAAVLDRDPAARRLYETTRRLDLALGAALRDEMPCEAAPLRLIPSLESRRFRPFARWALGAVAAAVAALAWINPFDWRFPHEHGDGRLGAAMLPVRRAPGDTVAPLPSAYVRPEVQVQGLQRNWILVPSEQPGLILIVEVDRAQTHAIAVQRDF